jgi:zinc protease
MAARNPPRVDQSLLESFWREPVHRSVLPNGLTLLLKPDHSAPIASVQVWVKTGSIHEGGHLGAGLSHYLEHLLFKGTTHRAGREISAAVQACGGGINAYTTFDRTVYYIDLPAESVDFALELLADMVLNSTLPPEEVTREKDVILREIDMGQDDPDQRLGESLFQAAFREHPYRHPIIGYREVFAETTRDALLDYYRTRYVPNNLVVVVTGAIDPVSLQATVARHFGSAPRRRLPPVLVPEEPLQLAPRAHHRFENVEVSRAGLAWQIPGLTHPDAPLLDVLATVLGGGESSLLWQEIRDQAGLVHAIDATSWSPGSVGLFYISYTSEPTKREAATTAILRALQRWARRGLTSAQVRKAVRQLVVGEINSRKTMSGQASRLGVAEVVAGDLAFGRNYFRRLFAVTPADLKRAIKVYLAPDNLTSVSLNPAPVAKAAPEESALATAALPEFEEIKFPNGARLVLQAQRNLPNLHLRLTCLGGPVYEASDKRGATALLATLLTKDTQRRSAAEVANFIEEVGGSFGPFSGNNSFGLAVEVLSTEAGRALQVLADAILQPAFRPSTFKLEREAQLAAVRQDQDDVVTLGQKLLRQKFFGDHPLAIESIGCEAGLTALTPADLKALHGRLCVAANVVLSVAGDFDRKVILPQLKAFLLRLPCGQVTPPAGTFAGPTAHDYVEKQPRQQAVVFEAYPAPILKAADFYIAEVADELFSGMSSRLFERVREEKGLAYFVRSARVIGLDAAMFYFMAGTAPGSEAAVQAEIEGEIARVAAGEVTPAEIQRCQTRLKAARRMSLQTNASRAAQAGLNAIYGLPVNDWKNYGAHIDAVRIEDLTRFARTYLHRDGRLRLVVRP